MCKNTIEIDLAYDKLGKKLFGDNYNPNLIKMVICNEKCENTREIKTMQGRSLEYCTLKKS